MGKVQQRAGGGKVTVTGLTANILKAGNTVTIKQGNKILFQVTGTYRAPLALSRTQLSSYNIKSLYPNDYTKLTAANFGPTGALALSARMDWPDGYLTKKGNGSISWSYNASTGVLTVSGAAVNPSQGGSYDITSITAAPNAMYICLPTG